MPTEPTEPAAAGPQPPRRRPARLGLITAAIGVAGLCLAGGWWLGQLQRPKPAVDTRAEPALQRQADQLLARLERGETSPAEQRRLLELLVGLDRRQEATTVLERLADQQPERWSLRLLLAELRRDLNDRTGAEREVRQLLNRRPEQVEGLQLMALLQLETGRGALATKQLQSSLERARKPKLRPEALPIGLLLANVQHRQGQMAPAEAVLRQLVSDFPADQRPLLALALIQQERGNTQAAQQSLATARARRPDQPDPRLDAVAAAWGLAPLRDPSVQSRPAGPSSARQSP